MGTILRGAHCLLEGFGLLKRSGIRPFVLMPLAINIVLFAGLIGWAASGFGALVDGLLPELPAWLTWLAWLLWLLFALLTLLVLFYGFALLANLVGAPFNGLLAARVEAQLTGADPAQQAATGRGLLGEAIDALGSEIRKLGYFAAWTLLIAALSLALLFIPVLNMLIPVLWFLFGSWIMALEYSDYPLGNRGLSFAAQRELVRAHRAAALGFGAATSLATLIPLVNFVAMPAAVAGATVLWNRLRPVPGGQAVRHGD